MIGSPLGLHELPHVPAPAGVKELAHSSRSFEFPEITDLPFLIVPGIRTGPLMYLDSLSSADIMRGEETLCLGLVRLGLLELPGLVLNLGSHWKAIQISAEGQIESSVTTLSGELVQATKTQTILRSSVATEWPEELNLTWLQAGAREQRDSGLTRALFCVRLLELANEGTAEYRFAFLAGAYIAADMQAFKTQGLLAADIPVVIAGHKGLADAWRKLLVEISVSANVLTTDEVERAFLTGLKSVLVAAA
jgi:2-dehydro-3-deoxygalactonokinase